jgi:hypothetical protein
VRPDYGTDDDIVPPTAGKQMEIWILNDTLTTDLSSAEQGFLDAATGVIDAGAGKLEDLWHSRDARVLVVSAGGENEHLYFLARDAMGMPWSPPIELLADVGVDDSDRSPWLSNDLCVLYYTRRVNEGESVIWRVERGPGE